MMKKILNCLDIAIFSGWTIVGILNLIFLLTNASVANIQGLFIGRASVSFVFMASSAVIMLTLSAAASFIFLRRKTLFIRARSSFFWRAARIILSLTAIFFISFVALMITASYPPPAPQTRDMLILGAHVSDDGLSEILLSRLEAAAKCATENPDMQIYVSGGQGLDEPLSEAEAMRNYLAARGIAEDRIFMETESHNTFENLINTFRMTPDGAGKRKITIVTSEFHICRTTMLASRAGFEPFFIAAKTPLGILPSCYSREIFGLIKSYFVDKLK